ncbi:MAG: murein biosynthesis integral membrane protein MurJ [Desulfovibrionales bacterium]|nr:murein biosynthesis integral membrane protein MurJ [Desulfovibrionales bacterium]
MSGMGKRTLRAAAIISGASLVSRLLGLLRDCIIASLLGTTPAADALIVAFRIPNLMRKLFADGSLSTTLTAKFTQIQKEHGKACAYALFRACTLWAVLLLTITVGIAEVFSPSVTSILAPGIPATLPRYAYTLSLVQTCLPYIGCIGLVALFSSLLHSQQSFTLPATVPVVLNTTLIIGAGIAWLFSLPVAPALCTALLIGGILQLAVLLPPLLRKNVWQGHWTLRTPHAAAIGKKLAPTILSSGVLQLSILVVTALASFLPEGTIATFYFAEKLVQFPLGLIGVAIGITVLPKLTAMSTLGIHDRFQETLTTAVHLALFIALPASAGLFALADPITQLFFERGAFSMQDSVNTGTMLQAFTLGLPAFTITRPLLSGCFAQQNTRVPAIAGVASLVMTACSGLLLMQYMDGTGLALAVALGGWANCILLYKGLSPQTYHPLVTRWVLLYCGLSLLVGALALWSLRFGVYSIISIPILALGYFGVCLLLRTPQALLLRSAILPKRTSTL